MAGSNTSSSPESSATGGDLPTVRWDQVEHFVGQLTHDVRNGLNALELQLTFLGEISTDPEAADEVKRLRGTLGNVTRQLQTLRSAVGVTTPYPLEYPAGEFFDDLRERFAKSHPAAKTEAAQIEWTIEIDPETLLSVDPDLAIGALLELLANAQHFAQTGTDPIRVIVSATGTHAVFTLHEPQPTEPGVPPADWGRTPLRTTRRGAYGLGLFRVRRSLEIQGGTLEMAYSCAQLTLTTTVTLPRVPATPP